MVVVSSKRHAQVVIVINLGRLQLLSRFIEQKIQFHCVENLITSYSNVLPSMSFMCCA